MEKTKTTKVNIISKYIYIYNIFPLLSGSDFNKLKILNKYFSTLFTDYKAIHETELKKLALEWKFLIDIIDIDRATASACNRVYPTSVNGEYRVIKADTILCTSSAGLGVLKQVNNSFIEKIEDRGSLCGGGIMHFVFHHDLDLSITCSQLKKGMYKLYIRHDYPIMTSKFSEIICSVNVRDTGKEWIKIYESKFFSKEKIFELMNEKKIKNSYGSSRISMENNPVCLINSYLTDLDLTDYDDSDNLQVVFRLETKNRNEPLIKSFLDGVILEYVI